MSVITIVPIVEGHGEVEAVPVVIRRIADSISGAPPVKVLKPVRVPRQRVVKEGELERAVELAARLSPPDGRIIVLLDADSDCPAALAPELLARASSVRNDRKIRVVLAKSEYESWFVGAVESISGFRGLRDGIRAPVNPEEIQSAKGWLRSQMQDGFYYRETLEQAKFSARFDLAVARAATPSFDKFYRDVLELLS